MSLADIDIEITTLAKHWLTANSIELTQNSLRKYLANDMTKSLKMDWVDWFANTGKGVCDQTWFDNFKYVALQSSLPAYLSGYGTRRGNMSWSARVSAWKRSKEAVFLVSDRLAGKMLILHGNEIPTEALEEPREGYIGKFYILPIFASKFKQVEKDIPSNLCQEVVLQGTSCGTGRSVLSIEPKTDYTSEFDATFNTKTNSITESNEQMTKSIQVPSAFSAAVEQNKEAMQLAAKLSVGKAGNAFLLDTLLSKLPWYAKVFGKSQALKDNPLTKVATAQLANLLAQHFAKDNAKVTYVADAMLQEAMVDLITNADIVNDLIKKLGSFAGDISGETK